ncbi:hypothetical protein JW905_05205 [bacterium]|nr:hypothetical protein [candidate division CSSED10-310 bacterium]
MKRPWTERMEKLDRRYIFLFVAAAIFLPFIRPLGLPVSVTGPVRAFHDRIEALPENAVVLLTADWDPGSRAELLPMNVAVLHHLFSKPIRVIGMSLWPPGPRMLDECIEEVAGGYHKTYGRDYVNLGFKEGREVVMVALGESFVQTFPTDFHHTPLHELPIMDGIDNYNGIDLIVTLSAGYPGTKEWVQQVQKRFKKDMISGCAGVSSPEYYPYFESGQLLGLVGGLKACAEYEILLGKQSRAVKAMDAQALGHYIIIFFIVLGNVLFLINKFQAGRRS